MYRVLLKTILTLLLVAGNTSAVAQKMPWELQANSLDDLVRNGIVLPLNTNEKSLMEKFGQPHSIQRTKVKNKYYDSDDVVVTYTYPGLEISYYHHMDPEHGWKGIARIELTTNKYPIANGIYIDMPLSEIEQRFGQFHLTKWEMNGFLNISYASWDSVHDQIIFVIKDNILKKFVWSNWP